MEEPVARRLARSEQTARVRVARDKLRQVRDLIRTADAPEGKIAELAPRLLDEPGFGPVTAAKRLGRRRPAVLK